MSQDLTTDKIMISYKNLMIFILFNGFTKF